MEHRRHPQSELKPSMSTHEFSALVESMKAHGFDDSFPILLFENQIVDGWQRYKAALKAGVTPAFRVWRGARRSCKRWSSTPIPRGGIYRRPHTRPCW